MKRFLIFGILFTNAVLWGQAESVLLKSFVKQDTVLLRWAPANANLMIQGLRNGYVVERTTNDSDNNNALKQQQFVIEPFEKRKADFQNSSVTEIREMAEFVSDWLNRSAPSAQSGPMAFALLSIGASSNKELAKLLGLFYEDQPESQQAYNYRVLLRNSEIKSNTITIVPSVVSTNADLTVLSGSARPKLKQAYLNWEAESLQADYVGYWIERSVDSIHFEKRNTLPYLFLKSQDETTKTDCDFVDTNVVEGLTYFYRITGINHFAETGKSSNTVKVYIPKSVYGEVHIDSIRAAGTTRHIHGEFVSYRNQNELTKWVVLRSDSLLFGYTFLAELTYTSNSFQFTADVPLESGDRYYYKVAAIGADNDTVYSFPYYFFTLDQVPPIVPVDLKGMVNDSGVVALNWTANPEKDIRGYRVYRSNALHEEFVEVTKVFCTQAHFSDTLNLRNLTSEIYYRISAVDLNYNNSPACEPVKLLKPDTIAPVAAVFKNYEMHPDGLSLSWNNSTSTDVFRHVLLRQKNGHTDTLISWKDSTTQWKDTTGIPGNGYHYSIITSDISANVSSSEKLFVNYETGFRNGVNDLQASVNRQAGQITLSWQLPDPEIYAVQIYRAKNDGSFILYKTLRDPGVVSFADSNLSMNNTYRYKIKVVYKSGVSSALSKAIEVLY